VTEEHDRDQRRQLPPDLDVEQAEGRRERGRERDDDREADQGHHPGLPLAQLPESALDENAASVDKHDDAEQGRDQAGSREGWRAESEPILDVV